jgi:hypothetical protein
MRKAILVDIENKKDSQRESAAEMPKHNRIEYMIELIRFSKKINPSRKSSVHEGYQLFVLNRK